MSRLARGIAPVACLFALLTGWPAPGAGQQDVDAPYLPPGVEGMVSASPWLRSEGQLDLEAAVSEAELILVARLADVTESKIVYGGKREAVTTQYRLEPVDVLKGVFAQGALLLTDEDLRLGQYADARERMTKGDLFLVLLARQGPGFFNCNSASSLGQSIPKLEGPADPLISAVKTLISVVMKRDRKERLDLIVRGLEGAKGRDAVALLSSLRRRAILVPQVPGAADAAVRLVESDDEEVAMAAATTLEAIAAADYRDQPELRRAIVGAVVKAAGMPARKIPLGIQLIEVLGRCGAPALEEPAFQRLRIDQPISTFAERAARLSTLRRLGAEAQGVRVVELYSDLLLDNTSPAEEATTRCLVRLAPDRAAPLILQRLASKRAAGISGALEVRALADLPKGDAAGPLLQVAASPMDLPERVTWADAARRVADPRMIPKLADWLDLRMHPFVYRQAQEALMAIDTDESAHALAPFLGAEADLDRKLQIAEFLGRHGLKDGYAFAIEHVSEPPLRERAVSALAAIREPKAIPELRKILDAGNDLNWTAAAMRALGRLGVAEVAPQLLDAAADLDAPLAPHALLALGDLGEERAIPSIRQSLASRNDEVVVAGIRSAAAILKAKPAAGDDLRGGIVALLANHSASQPVRSAALDALVALDDPRLPRTLSAVVRDAAIEGTALLAEAEKQLAARKVALEF